MSKPIPRTCGTPVRGLMWQRPDLFCFHLIFYRVQWAVGGQKRRKGGHASDRWNQRKKKDESKVVRLADGARPGATLRLGTVISDGTNWSPPLRGGTNHRARCVAAGRAGPRRKGHQQMGPSTGETVRFHSRYSAEQCAAAQHLPPEPRQSQTAEAT